MTQYDENNNLIHFKDNFEIEYWKREDSLGNTVWFKDNNGIEFTVEIF